MLHQVEVQEHTDGGLSGHLFWQTKIREMEVQKEK